MQMVDRVLQCISKSVQPSVRDVYSFLLCAREALVLFEVLLGALAVVPAWFLH
jgi:hypothetical protein